MSNTTETAVLKKDEYEGVARLYDLYHQCPLAKAEDLLVKDAVEHTFLESPQGLVLDIGCGTGMILEYLKFPTEAYMGIDRSPAMLEKARLKFPGYRFIEASAEKLGVSSQSAGLAMFLFGVFPEVDPSLVLPELARVLKHQGRFLIIFYSPNIPKDWFQIAFQGEGVEIPQSRFYRVQEARRLFKYPLIVDMVIPFTGPKLYALSKKKWFPKALLKHLIILDSNRLFKAENYEAGSYYILIGKKV